MRPCTALRTAFVLCLLSIVGVARAQNRPPSTDPRIERIVREISPDRIKTTIDKLVSFGTRHTLSDTSDPVHGIGAARRWVKAEFERYAAASGGRLTVRFDNFMVPASPRIPHPASLTNVVAVLRPAGVPTVTARGAILVGAHLDSRATDVLDAVSPAPGADDDGSGVAAVLELARVLSTVELQSPVIFICYSGEEQGLFGSKHFADQALRQGIQIAAVLNNDIVGGIRGGEGRTDSTSVRVFSPALSPLDTGSVLARRNALGEENDGLSRSLARYCKETGEAYLPGFSVRMVYRDDRFLRGGDQIPYQDHGIAAVRFSEVAENFDHQHQNVRSEGGKQYGDLPGFVNAQYCANIARVNAAVAASLALAPLPPQNPELVTAALAYDSRLHWNASTGAAGYYVRWRETTAPVWQFSTFTPDTSVDVRVSKDDVLFGVQAVSPQGDASMYVLPLPAR